jgi:single-strand DNA-binding protein
MRHVASSVSFVEKRAPISLTSSGASRCSYWPGLSAAKSAPAPAPKNFPLAAARQLLAKQNSSSRSARGASLARFAAPQASMPPNNDRHRNGDDPKRWREKMAHLCEMNQIGHVASVKSVGKNLIVRIASNANYKNGEGAWIERTHWNEHMIFERQAGLLKWASDSLKPGDLVHVRSTAFQTEWEKDGETRYGQTFAVNELTLLTAKADKKGKQEETAKSRGARSR